MKRLIIALEICYVASHLKLRSIDATMNDEVNTGRFDTRTIGLG